MEQNVNQVAKEHAETAVQMAAGKNRTLDYSIESIHTAEGILAEISSQVKEEFIQKDQVPGLADVLGCYVGETLRKLIGRGTWVIPSDGPGSGAWTLVIDGTQLFFPAKAYRRIMNGPEDNIETMFKLELSRFSGELTK